MANPDGAGTASCALCLLYLLLIILATYDSNNR